MKRLTFGFDPSTLFGWAVFAEDVTNGVVASTSLVAGGTWDFGELDHPGERFEQAREHMIGVFDVHACDEARVVYEDCNVKVFKDKNNLRVYTGLVTTIFQACAVAGYHNIVGVSPTSLKKYATGHARATKQMMLTAAYRAFKTVPQTDDHADAIWLAHFGVDAQCPIEKMHAPPPKVKKTGSGKLPPKNRPSSRTST